MKNFARLEGGTFTYKVSGNSLELSRTNRNVSKSTFKKVLALENVPLENTVPLQNLQAPSCHFNGTNDW